MRFPRLQAPLNTPPQTMTYRPDLIPQAGGPTSLQTQQTLFSSRPKKPPIYTVQNAYVTSTRSAPPAYALFPPTQQQPTVAPMQIQIYGVAVTKRYVW